MPTRDISQDPPASASPAAGSALSGSANPPQPVVVFDSATAQAAYANFCRVTGTPEELIVDFALNAQSFDATTEPIHATQRVVMNYYTAKRLLTALHLTLQRHESTFGALETDIRKRVRQPST